MNKSGALKLFRAFCLWVIVVFTFTLLSAQADQIKTNHNNLLDSCGSWGRQYCPDIGNDNANIYIPIPVSVPPASIASGVSAGGTNGNIGISFPIQPGYVYQVEYKTNLTDAVSRFYRVQIQ